MDSATTLIGLILLALFAGPVIYLIMVQKRTVHKKMKKLEEIKRQNNLAADATEETGLLFLGLDSKAKKLIVIEPINNYNFMIVDLQEMKTCKLQTLDFAERPGKHRLVGLELIGKRTNKKDFEIMFYDEDGTPNIDPDAELVKARKWETLINNCLAA